MAKGSFPDPRCVRGHQAGQLLARSCPGLPGAALGGQHHGQPRRGVRTEPQRGVPLIPLGRRSLMRGVALALLCDAGRRPSAPAGIRCPHGERRGTSPRDRRPASGGCPQSPLTTRPHLEATQHSATTQPWRSGTQHSRSGTQHSALSTQHSRGATHDRHW